MKDNIAIIIFTIAVMAIWLWPAPAPEIIFDYREGTVTENAVPFGTYIAEGD